MQEMVSALGNKNVLISSVIAALITLLTALMAQVVELREGQTIADISSNVWILMLAGAALQVLKDVQSSRRQPPPTKQPPVAK